MKAVIIEHGYAVNKQHAAVIARHIEGVGSAFFYDEMTFIFRGEIVAGRAVPERLLARHIVQTVDNTFRIRRRVKIYLVKIAQGMTDIVVRRAKTRFLDHIQYRNFVLIQDADCERSIDA